MTQAQDFKVVLDALANVDLVLSEFLEPKRRDSEEQMLAVLAALDNDEVAPCAPDREAVKRWLAEGKAHIAFRGHAVFYDGGEKPLSVADWEAQYARQH